MKKQLVAGLLIGVVAALVATAQTACSDCVTVEVTIPKAVYDDISARIRLERQSLPVDEVIASIVHATIRQAFQEAFMLNKSAEVKTVEDEMRVVQEKLESARKSELQIRIVQPAAQLGSAPSPTTTRKK